MEETIVSAPGKIILAGEHAVVYGYPAIVAAINMRITVVVKQEKPDKKYTGLVKYALEQLGIIDKVKLNINSELPVGGGLGSSAALATALVWAIKKDSSQAEKDQWVKIIEDFQHGKSSGVDQTIVREGGWLRFQQGKWQVIKLQFKAAILIDSGKPKESTGEMVKMIAEGRHEAEFKKIGELVNNWRPELIQENERLLEKIGVVGEKAKKIIREIEAMGGQAKICGAGGVKAGSGMILAVHKNKAKLKQLIDKNKWKSSEVRLGDEGVRYEN